MRSGAYIQLLDKPDAQNILNIAARLLQLVAPVMSRKTDILEVESGYEKYNYTLKIIHTKKDKKKTQILSKGVM